MPVKATEQPQAPQPTPSAKTTSPPMIVSFVCEDDIRTALKKNEKVYVNSKTIITPAARDLGTEKDVLVFAT